MFGSHNDSLRKFNFPHIIRSFRLHYAVLCLTKVIINAPLTHFCGSVKALLMRKHVLLSLVPVYSVHAPTTPT